MGTKAFSLTSAVAQGMLVTASLGAQIGANAKLRIFGGTVPTNADAALASNPQLAELIMGATAFSGAADAGAVARATANAITPDSSADASGTATFWRIYDSAGTTAKCQGNADTSGADLNLNTTSFTLGSQIAVNSATFDQPKGP